MNGTTPAGEDGPFCPSAQPDVTNGVVIGVVGGSPGEPRVTYLDEPLPVTPDLLALAAPVHPTEVFRMGAPCARSACQHFEGTRCALVRQLVAGIEPAAQELPRCGLRSRCRWWREEGVAACRRCPIVVTEVPNPTEEMARAARPAGQARDPRPPHRGTGPRQP